MSRTLGQGQQGSHECWSLAARDLDLRAFVHTQSVEVDAPSAHDALSPHIKEMGNELWQRDGPRQVPVYAVHLKGSKQEPITGHIRKVRTQIDLSMSLPAEVLFAGQGDGMPQGTHFMFGAVAHIGEAPSQRALDLDCTRYLFRVACSG